MGTSSAIPTAAPSQTATLTLSIGQVQTTLAAATLTVALGAYGSIGLTVAATNFTGNSLFSVSGIPSNVTYTFAPNALAGSGSTTLTILPSSVVAAGVYTVTVKTYAGETIATSTFQLTI